MSNHRQPGLYPEDLPPDKLEKLLREGYTVSPNSGRLRKKVSTRKKHSFFSKRKAKKYTRIALWALLILAFLVSLVIIVPEMSVQNPNQKNQPYPTKPRR